MVIPCRREIPHFVRSPFKNLEKLHSSLFLLPLNSYHALHAKVYVEIKCIFFIVPHTHSVVRSKRLLLFVFSLDPENRYPSPFSKNRINPHWPSKRLDKGTSPKWPACRAVALAWQLYSKFTGLQEMYTYKFLISMRRTWQVICDIVHIYIYI